MADTPNLNSFVDTLNANFKTVYADSLIKLVPEETLLLKSIPFDNSNKLGKRYEQAVSLSYGGGFTYAGTDDMFTLNKAQAGKMATAELDANEYLLRENISYKAIARSQNGGQAAFVDATKHIVKGMNVAYSREMETQLLYGGSGIGVVSAVDVPTATVTISLAEWADGIWTGTEGSKLVQAYAPNGTLKVHTGGVLLDSDGTLAVRVLEVNTAARTVKLDNVTNIAVNDVLYAAGSRSREMVGLHRIAGNSGVLFGIDAATSGLWRGNTVNIAGKLTVKKILAGIAPVIGKGLSGQDLKLFIGVRSFDDVTSDIIDKRTVDSSYSTANFEVGTRKITIFGQNGVIEVHPSTFVKEGYAYGLVLSDFSRIGSRDKSFTMPGEDGQFFKQVPNASAFEMRVYSDQALFCRQPGRQILFTGIVPGNPT